MHGERRNAGPSVFLNSACQTRSKPVELACEYHVISVRGDNHTSHWHAGAPLHWDPPALHRAYYAAVGVQQTGGKSPSRYLKTDAVLLKKMPGGFITEPLVNLGLLCVWNEASRNAFLRVIGRNNTLLSCSLSYPNCPNYKPLLHQVWILYLFQVPELQLQTPHIHQLSHHFIHPAYFDSGILLSISNDKSLSEFTFI